MMRNVQKKVKADDGGASYDVKKKKGGACSSLIRLTPGQIIFCGMSVFSLFLIIRNSDIAIDYMMRGMKLCTTTVIPSLFPFMVTSELIVMSGAGEAFGKLLGKPAKFLFGIGGGGCCAFLLGTLCGFPVGTRSAVSLYRQGAITKSELSHIITFSNNPSSAFVISAVGVSLFGCRKFGVALYFMTLASSVITGIAGGIIRKIATRRRGAAEDGERVECYPDGSGERKRSAGIGGFTSAITSAASGMLNVCAFVIFFSAFMGTLGTLLSSVGLSGRASAFIFCIFELTGGVCSASGLTPVGVGAVMAAFAVGWSGLSVHFQIISLCNGINISFRPFFAAKLAQGIINAIMMRIYLHFARDSFIFDVKSVAVLPVGSGATHGTFAVIACAIFFLSLLLPAVLRMRE
ncbi:MAG: hypothetical protein ACI3XQ_05435 [Eubacteriales bacterium]